MAVVEDTLQAEPVHDGRVYGSRGSAASLAAHHDLLHLQYVFADDVETIAGRIRAGVLRMEEGQQHAARLEHRPETSHHRTHQAFIEIVGQVPAKDNIKVCGGIEQVVRQEFAAVEDHGSLLVFGDEVRLGRRGKQVFAVNLMTVFGEEGD